MLQEQELNVNKSFKVDFGLSFVVILFCLVS